jgi:hypothetical protein
MPDGGNKLQLKRNSKMNRADPLRGQVGGGLALEIETFLGPVKWHRSVRRVQFGAQNFPPSPAFGLIYKGAVGQPRQTTSLYNPMSSPP